MLKAQPLPAVYFALGTAVHNVTEEIDRFEWNQRAQPTTERYTGPDFRSVYYSEMKKGLAQEPDIKNWLAGGSDGPLAAADLALETGPRCIENWKGFTSEVFQVNDIELDVTCRLPGMYLKTKGFVDRVGDHAKYGAMIVDIKSGKNPPKDKGKQLKDYGALLLASTGQQVTKGAYYMAQEGKLGKVYDLDQTPEDLGAENKALLRTINSSDYEAKVEFTCRFCTQQVNCYAFAGDTPRTKYYDPSHPEYDHMREIPF
jgi:hypothetical protein